MYTPGRNGHYYYLWDLMQDIEENQCRTCAFSKLFDPDENKNHAEEYPMCYEVEGMVIAEEPVPALDEREDGSVVCTKYRNVERAQEAHPDQGRLL